MIAVQLTQHSRDVMDSFRAHTLALPEVLAVYYLSGSNDFMVHVAVRDTHHLRDLVLESFSLADVKHLETSMVFEHHRRWSPPLYR